MAVGPPGLSRVFMPHAWGPILHDSMQPWRHLCRQATSLDLLEALIKLTCAEGIMGWQLLR